MVCRSVKESEFEKLMGPLPGSASTFCCLFFLELLINMLCNNHRLIDSFSSCLYLDSKACSSKRVHKCIDSYWKEAYFPANKTPQE